VEHQAGTPVLMKPLSGNSSDAQAFGQVIRDHITQLHTTYGSTYLVADSALYSADNLPKLAETQMKWLTRVPATLGEAQVVLAQADPQTMAPCGGLSLPRRDLDLWRCRTTLGAHLFRAAPIVSPAHGVQAVAQAQ
jgi:hypothetical protein